MLLLSLVAMCIVTEFGCSNNTEKKTQTIETGEVEVFTIDSCEYIAWAGYKNGGMIHKQNCKFCVKRNKK